MRTNTALNPEAPVEASHDDMSRLFGDVKLTSQQTNDKISILVEKPGIPIGGRLTHFLPEWKGISTDQ